LLLKNIKKNRTQIFIIGTDTQDKQFSLTNRKIRDKYLSLIHKKTQDKYLPLINIKNIEGMHFLMINIKSKIMT